MPPHAPASPPSLPSAGAGPWERLSEIIRTVLVPALGLLWSWMPPGPRPPGPPIFIWLRFGGVRVPDRCPACGGAAEVDHELELEQYLYLVLWVHTTRARLTARFCRRCLEALGRRRVYVWARTAIPFVLLLLAAPMLASWRTSLRMEESTAVSPAAWAAIYVAVNGSLFFEGMRWLWKAYKRRWNVGLRIAAIESGEPGRFCVELDDPEYALELRTLNGLAVPG